MADRSSFGVNQPADWRRRLAGASLLLVGIGGVGTAAYVYYDAWSTHASWTDSPEAAAIARQEAQPTPIRVAPSTPEPFDAVEPLPAWLPTAASLEPTGTVSVTVPTPTVVAAAEDISLDSADFRFLDPPEPNAHARLALTLTDHAVVPSGPVLLRISASWFENFSIIGTSPAVSADRTDDNGLRTFSFPPLAAGATTTYELHVTALGETTQPPAVQALLADGDPIGEIDKPATFAPAPRPGPVMSIDIPRLKLHSSVVQTTWDPPPFTVGQIKGSANVTQGNTVLVGHLTGLAGNVFAHLDQLKPGDPITAVSRGVSYSFVVSRTFEAPNTDAAPINPSDDSHLTLMTCAGVWNPFTQEYSRRLWVIAEAPEQAAVTIANVAATATVQATLGAEATASAATAAAKAATATTVAAAPTVTPTPYAGEPAPLGGIGNTRASLEKAFGPPIGETPAKLVVFRQPGRELHVTFTPDPARAALVAEFPSKPLDFDAAVRESRTLFPSDAQPRANAPEGNSQFVVERFTSPSLAQAFSTTGDFSVIYLRDPRGGISHIVLGLGDDLDPLIRQSGS